jgi:hypothetical protein
MNTYDAGNLIVFKTFHRFLTDGQSQPLDDHLSKLSPPDCRCSLSAKRLDQDAQECPGQRQINLLFGKGGLSMSAPRDSRCRFKECYNCKHRLNSVAGGKPEYNCGLALDGTIRVVECGGLRYYLAATKAQRREQQERLMEHQVS